jgi:hypothetical protein
MRCGAESRSPSGAPSANLSLFMCVEIVKRVSVVIAVKTAMGFELKQDSSLWFGTDIFRLSFLCLLSMSLNAQDQPLGITASHLRFACEWLGASSPRFHKILRLLEPHPSTFPNDFIALIGDAPRFARWLQRWSGRLYRAFQSARDHRSA